MEAKSVTVPDRAIIRSGERNIVVVALGGGYFAPRDVKLGVEANGYVEILQGLKEGEQVVTSSQFLIDSESNLKAALHSMLGHAGNDSSNAAMQTEPVEKSQTKAGVNEITQQGKIRRKLEPRNAAHIKMDGRETGSNANAAHELAQEDNRGSKQLQRFIDPVCGMEADGSEELSYAYNGNKYYFCGSGDMEKFKRSPQQYIPAAAR